VRIRVNPLQIRSCPRNCERRVRFLRGHWAHANMFGAREGGKPDVDPQARRPAGFKLNRNSRRVDGRRPE